MTRQTDTYLQKMPTSDRKEWSALKENKRETGGRFESQAAEFLESKGLVILERNYRCRTGEIDLIARDGGYLVFVEVKYRTDSRAGGALAAVGRAKQRVISKVARYYLMTHHGSVDVACRFDVVGFDDSGICWIENAFDYCT